MLMHHSSNFICMMSYAKQWEQKPQAVFESSHDQPMAIPHLVMVNALHGFLSCHFPVLYGLHGPLPLSPLHSMAGLAVVEGNGGGRSSGQCGFKSLCQPGMQAPPLRKGDQVVGHIPRQHLGTVLHVGIFALASQSWWGTTCRQAVVA